MSKYALLTTSGIYAERSSAPNTSTTTEPEKITASDQKQTQETEKNEAISKKPVMKNKVSSPSSKLILDKLSEDEKFELFMARMEESFSLTFVSSDKKNTKADESPDVDVSSSSQSDGLANAENQYEELQQIFENFFWHPDEGSFENLQKKINELKNADTNFEGINASSLALRVMAAQKNDSRDLRSLVITLANLGAKISCQATDRRMLTGVIDREESNVLRILVKQLRDGKRLEKAAEDMCNFALKAGVPLKSFESYLKFSLSKELLSYEQIGCLIAGAMKSWISDPENANFMEKFVLLIKMTGEDINKVKIGRYTAIDWAIKGNHTKMVDVLLALRAEPKIDNESKKTD